MVFLMLKSPCSDSHLPLMPCATILLGKEMAERSCPPCAARLLTHEPQLDVRMLFIHLKPV